MTSAPLKKLNDGTQIPQLGLGVFQMDDDEAHRATLAAFEAGYRHVDTAAIYRNEVGVGRAIAESGLARDEIFVTTKLWNKAQGRDNAREGITRSLEKLGLDHVDLYLIHWPCPAAGTYVETWEQMIDFRSEGLTRSIGVSNFLPEHLDTILDETGITPSVNQIELHPTFQPDDLLNHCSDLGVVIESWSPLGQASDLEHPEILRIAEATGATPAQVIIRWHLGRGFVTIPKSTNPERIRANFEALNVTLNSEQMEAIDGISAGNRIGPDPATVEP
ncbi:aldo/keto reductase [Tessaracoccus antarcticus]|uniref:Aldo/keto reductase n=1 Tax=Tessaracoccus antarcticus TaxID=2479848 RepID=A0A3M0GA08_9ACTN|nr:aldo/keto reductase [Tessaracoccus antarcticus]RMB61835.1 aldo/keto reductase [Tessaracoccus antarcticus]